MNDKIIARSVTLFNENGINQTSFRNIASSLEISDGHVRYYFKTKEKLLLAIFDKMNNEILTLAQQTQNETLSTSSHLKNILSGAFAIMVNYSFFFMESPKTFNQFPALALVYKNLVEDRKTLFLSMFQNLKHKGFFKKSFSDDIQEHAFYCIFIISDSWIRYYTILNSRKPNKQAIDFHSNLAFSILSPYIKE